MPGSAIPAWVQKFSQTPPQLESDDFDEDDDLPRLALN